ncbi:MAG: metallophosphoesterase [Armatimonadota bacterium]|nr:metallophosphoesterase [Armatimonadota bacterium]
MRCLLALAALLTAVPASALLAAPGAQAPAVLVGAGDIASCDSDGDEATARILDATPGTVFTAGDNAYERGTDREFAECYHPTWGRHRARTRPSAGNHDYGTPGAAGYFRYFGEAAGEPGAGYYSYEIAGWQVIALNSNCRFVGGCGSGSPQLEWLRRELASSRAQCTVAYWHHPRFSSGLHGGTGEMAPIWETLHAAGADVVVAGHDHTYERFAPLDAAGRPDPGGMRSFVVGTGGRSLYPFRGVAAGSEVRRNDTYGVLKLTLGIGRYEWEFLPVAGRTFRDLGAGDCR